jgi:hypothetical protein
MDNPKHAATLGAAQPEVRAERNGEKSQRTVVRAEMFDSEHMKFSIIILAGKMLY